MDKLDAIFDQDLETAVERAKQLGRFEIADYLSLKASNDRIREESIKWLFETVVDIVLTFNRHGAKITIEEKNKHELKYGSSTLSGRKMELRQGLRCMTLEAGWTNRPGDGIIRGGSLAYSRISHFGFRKETQELVLHTFEEKPQWFTIIDEKLLESFNVAGLRRHFEVFLG